MPQPRERKPQVRKPKAGDLLHIDVRASVQFVAVAPFLFRVIRPLPWSTYEGWIWIEGYQLDANCVARERRSLFVVIAGLTYVREQLTSSQVRHREPTRSVHSRPSPTIRARSHRYIDANP